VSELYLLDDATARDFEPFALTRPVGELRAGALLIRERWEHATGFPARGLIAAPHLADFQEPWSVGVARGIIRKGAVVANARCAISLAPAPAAGIWSCGGRPAAVMLSRDVDVAELLDGRIALEALAGRDPRNVEVQGWWLDHVWDFITFLPAMLSGDIAALAPPARQLRQADVTRSGPHQVFVEEEATVEPSVFFDTTAGPVLVRRGATVQAFTRIVGPCVIGAEAQVGGDKIATCSIGEVCKVHGEVSTAIFLGHSNKGHDGFLGHSYLARWVNLGAGTITSNLKNTYGTVQFWTPSGEQDSGQQFLGTFFGDHAKTGIGTSLNTGTLIGAGANIYGSGMPPKMVPPFAWGDQPPYSTYRMDKFLDVAKRMMERRHVELTPGQARALTAAAERAKAMAWGGSAP
jgi:UDP-N-acetylglucosamine diphosphorylase / glucose-1-phosphate thymidylyltransferase / UDP-N-acetylgalactosamine diphosphorylase / glucosamine-1-phosphate N-acetyltransferase / galactosamine-1-phosphate N-acetyltransferase